MKTFQIYRTVSLEYFIEAETEAEAFELIAKGEIKPDEEFELSSTLADVYDVKIGWENESV